MTKDQISEYREKLTNIINENRDTAKDNGLKFALTMDQIAQREAITCTTAGDSYEAALQLFDEILSNG